MVAWAEGERGGDAWTEFANGAGEFVAEGGGDHGVGYALGSCGCESRAVEVIRQGGAADGYVGRGDSDLSRAAFPFVHILNPYRVFAMVSCRTHVEAVL